ncbi:hypothetical protein PSPO01_13216 [Paraphaeosphaeria sporulosa]
MAQVSGHGQQSTTSEPLPSHCGSDESGPLHPHNQIVEPEKLSVLSLGEDTNSDNHVDYRRTARTERPLVSNIASDEDPGPYQKGCPNQSSALIDSSPQSRKLLGDCRPPNSGRTEKQLYAIHVEVGSPDIDFWDNKVYFKPKRSKGKLCVGRTRKITCPQPLLIQWEKDILPRLMKDLAAVSSWSLPDETFEAELRMAGYVTKKDTTVELKPTVCIRCTSKTCRKEFEKAVKDLDYLVSFCSGGVEVRLGAPHLAATEAEALPLTAGAQKELPIQEENNINQVRMIQPWIDGDSACGLKLKISTTVNDTDIESISTIGGLIKVDGKIYGLTTAHGMIAPPKLPVSRPYSSCSSQVSTSESDSESELDDPMDLNHTRAKKAIATVHMPGQWNDLSFDGLACFCGQTQPFAPADDKLASNDADFALIELGLSSERLLFNSYEIHGEREAHIDSNIYSKTAIPGQVFLLLDNNPNSPPMKGYLLQGSANLRNKNGVFFTQKIELDRRLPKGVSGTWVIQENRLCGIVVAVYENEPYAHMITVDRMFQNIRDIVKAKSVTVATKKDLEGAYKKSERPESKRSVGNAGQSSQPAGDMSSTPMPVSAVINANTAPQQAQTTSVSSRTSDHPWTWSQEHSDYYKPVYGADGRLVKFVWGRATLSQTTSQQHRMLLNVDKQHQQNRKRLLIPPCHNLDCISPLDSMDLNKPIDTDQPPELNQVHINNPHSIHGQ